MKVYQQLARLVTAYHQVKPDYKNGFLERIELLLYGYFPHWSRFYTGTSINLDESQTDKIVLETEYHHMDGNGFYAGWSGWKLIITPSLAYGFDLDIELTYDDTDNMLTDSFEVDHMMEYVYQTFDFPLNKAYELEPVK